MNKQHLIYLGLICFCFISAASSTVTMQLVDPESFSPLPNNEIVIGTPAALLVTSDANNIWSGGIFIRGDQCLIGKLQGRRNDPNSRNFAQSCLPAAGTNPRVTAWDDSFISGYDLYNDDLERNPGKWFIIDYQTLQPGECKIEFYDYNRPDPNCWTEPDHDRSITVQNTPSRDFDGSGTVNLKDFADFASVWMDWPCGNTELCDKTDLDGDYFVGLNDLIMFSEYWMWGTPGWERIFALPDPNLIYTLADSGGLSELTLTTGESVTIYITMTTLEKDVKTFYLETILSDPNLGWIDNRTYDPNHPENSTAKILAQPRDSFFDSWYPGRTQDEGIEFFAASISSPMLDGWMASFVYTATAPGTMELRMINYNNIPALLEVMRITQVDLLSGGGESQMLMTSSESLTVESTDSTSSDSEITMSVEEQVAFLEKLWEEDPAIREMYTKEEWFSFVESVEESYQ